MYWLGGADVPSLVSWLLVGASLLISQTKAEQHPGGEALSKRATPEWKIFLYTHEDCDKKFVPDKIVDSNGTVVETKPGNDGYGCKKWYGNGLNKISKFRFYSYEWEVCVLSFYKDKKCEEISSRDYQTTDIKDHPSECFGWDVSDWKYYRVKCYGMGQNDGVISPQPSPAADGSWSRILDAASEGKEYAD
ncbi:Uu.00g032830.m01.CDS01 [Anthostomella pinea]|uniref:Uu.00g032830.m01.CDS01 n=1 Tax=Anthostomella pinea TaxID=933095 RepID=A0AAI8YD67_9PEZI|nr:Uu.00g032830.m01.CDS01 [Anthostomella pinea]